MATRARTFAPVAAVCDCFPGTVSREPYCSFRVSGAVASVTGRLVTRLVTPVIDLEEWPRADSQAKIG